MRNRILGHPLYVLASLAAIAVLALAGWLLFSWRAPGEPAGLTTTGAQGPVASVTAAGAPVLAEEREAMTPPDTATPEDSATATARPVPTATVVAPPRAGVGDTVHANGLAATLSDAQLFPWGPGVQLEFQLRNDSSKDLHFFIFPDRSFKAVDNHGNVYALRWAEYSGEVKLSRGQQVNLVKAFFAPSARDAAVGYDRKEGAYQSGTYIVVTMTRLGPLTTASWRVPLTE